MASREDRYEEPKVVITIPHNSPWAARGPVASPVASASFFMGFAMMINFGAVLLFVGGVLYSPQQRELYSSEISRCIQKKPCFDDGFSKRLDANAEKYRNLKQP